MRLGIDWTSGFDEDHISSDRVGIAQADLFWLRNLKRLQDRAGNTRRLGANFE
jgi:hypothetical protein